MSKTRKDEMMKKKKKVQFSAGTPRFEPFVNGSAGLAATGVRVGFPAERTVSLNYCAFVEMTSTLGSISLYQFRLNSCFDPDYTSTGHQPMGFDQWSLFYNHYVVEDCEYQVQLSPRDTADAMHYATHLSDDNTVPTGIADLMELGAATHQWMSGTPAHIFAGKVNMSRFFNRGAIASDDQLRAAVTANPIEQAFLTIRGSPCNQSSTVTTSILVKLTMKVRFMEPKDLAPSLSYKTPSGSKQEDEYEYVRVKKVGP